MPSPHVTSRGLTKTRAFSLQGQGYKFHVTRPISQARPSTIDMDIVMSPISGEGVTLYSFNKKSDLDAFVTKYGGEALEL